MSGTKSIGIPVTQNIESFGATFVNADSTTAKTLYTAGGNDAVVKVLNFASNDTSAVNIALYVNDGTADRLIGTIRVATLSGTDGAAASVDGLSGTLIPSLPYDANGKRVLPLKAGHILKWAPLVAVTAAKTVTAFGVAEEY